MKASFVSAALAVAMAAVAAPAAASVVFQAVMTHDQEVANPGIPDEGSSGLATFVLNDAQTRLTYDVRLTGLDLGRVDANGNPTLPPTGTNPDDDVIRLHIHRALVGLNGGIVFGMIDGSAALRNDVNTNDLVIDGPNWHITGAWDLAEGNGAANLGTELANLFRGGLYINVHTSDHAGGEIRGQILRVPEPGSFALLALGVLGLVVPPRRRRQA